MSETITLVDMQITLNDIYKAIGQEEASAIAAEGISRCYFKAYEEQKFADEAAPAPDGYEKVKHHMAKAQAYTRLAYLMLGVKVIG